MAIKNLTILHSNDIHGDFMPEEKNGKMVGGVSMLSGYISEVRSHNPNVIYAIAGDMFRGNIIDTEFKGLSTVEIVNMLYPDIVTLGNHEIDYGLAHLLFIEKCAKFPIINANLFITTNNKRLFEPYRILEVGGMHVMFIGILTDEILAQTRSEAVIGSFIDIDDAVREVGVICDNYKTTKVDLTVLLTHIGLDKDIELAEKLDPEWGVDMIIGGHTHTFMDEPVYVNGVPIVQAGWGSDQIGRWDIEYNDETKSVESMKWRCIPIDSTKCRNDPVLEQVLYSYKNPTEAKYSRVVCRFAKELTHPSRTQETELGNLFSDLLQVDSSFDLMIYGSGSIRLEKMGPIVQYQDLLDSSPYDAPIHMLEVTADQLRRMITYVFRDEAWTGHTEFYQYSKGMRIVYNRKTHEFEELTLNGEDISGERIIKIALQDYHFNNFTDFFNVPIEEVIANRRPRTVITSVLAIFEELLSNSNIVDANIEGRIVIKDE